MQGLGIDIRNAARQTVVTAGWVLTVVGIEVGQLDPTRDCNSVTHESQASYLFFTFFETMTEVVIRVFFNDAFPSRCLGCVSPGIQRFGSSLIAC